MKCPNCSFSYEGAPQRCPSCGRELRRWDPSRCEACGSRVGSTENDCPNCGTPRSRHTGSPVTQDQEAHAAGPGSPGFPSSRKPACMLSLLGVSAVIAVAGLFLARSFQAEHALDSETAAQETRGVLILNAMEPDSIHRGVIGEGQNTVETVWPRVLIDLPDSCSYPGPYDPCAAFRFTIGERRVLARIEASAPIDLVLTLLREENGVLSFAGWNEDGRPGSVDPMLLTTLDGGTYVALITNYGGWAFGDVRFIWSVVMTEIPMVTGDTTFAVTLSSNSPRALFDMDIQAGRTYSIRTVSAVSNLDSFIELRTEGGSVLIDDDSGRNSFCWGDAHLAFTAGPLHEGRATVTVRPYNASSSDYGDLEVIFTLGD